MEIEDRDFFKETFSEAELRELLGDRPVRDVFSFRSPSFKAMGLDPSAITDDEMVRLMLEEPRLMRRPIVEAGSELVIGADYAALEGMLGRG